MPGWPLWTEPRRMSWIRFTTNWIWEGIAWEGIPSSRNLTAGVSSGVEGKFNLVVPSWIQTRRTITRSYGGIPACAISLSVRRTWLNGILAGYCIIGIATRKIKDIKIKTKKLESLMTSNF